MSNFLLNDLFEQRLDLSRYYGTCDLSVIKR